MLKTGSRIAAGLAAALVLATPGESQQPASPAQPLNIDNIQTFLRASMRDGAVARAWNSWGEVRGDVHSIKFGNDSDLPRPPGFQANPCWMIVMLQPSPGRYTGVMIDFSRIEGVTAVGGHSGYMNGPYESLLWINGVVLGQGANNQAVPYHAIEFRFHLMNMRDRTVRAMQDLGVWCAQNQGNNGTGY